jgi:hypothetical protein
MGLEDGKQDNNNQIGSDEEQIDDEESQSISKTSRAQPYFLLETKDLPNGRQRDPAEQPGFRPIYGNMIFGAPDRWPLATRLTV